MTFTILEDPSLVNITIYSVCLSGEEDQFYSFTQKLSPLWIGGHGITIHVSLPYKCYIPNLVKIGPVVLEKKMLTDDGRRTTDKPYDNP